MVTERVIAREAAALGVTVTATTPTQDEVLPDLTARLEIGSIAASVLTDPLARAVFDHITRDVDVDEAAVADYHARNPAASPGARGATAGDAPTRPGIDEVRPHRRAAARAALAASVPALARPAPRRTWSGWPRLRASRRPAPARQHPQTRWRAPPWCSISAAPRSPPASPTDGRLLLHETRQPTPRADDPDQVGGRRTAHHHRRAGRRRRPRRRRRDLLGGPDRPARRHHQPDQHPAWRGFPVRDRVAAAVPGCRCNWPATAVHGARRTLARCGRARRSCSAWWSPPVSAAAGARRAPYDGRTGNAGTSVTSSSTSTARPAVAGPRLRRVHRQRTAPGGVGPGAGGWTGGDAGTWPTPPPAVTMSRSGLPPRRHRGGGDDRVGGRGVRPRPVVIGGAWPTPARCCSTRCTRRCAATPP